MISSSGDSSENKRHLKDRKMQLWCNWKKKTGVIKFSVPDDWNNDATIEQKFWRFDLGKGHMLSFW